MMQVRFLIEDSKLADAIRAVEAAGGKDLSLESGQAEHRRINTVNPRYSPGERVTNGSADKSYPAENGQPVPRSMTGTVVEVLSGGRGGGWSYMVQWDDMSYGTSRQSQSNLQKGERYQ